MPTYNVMHIHEHGAVVTTVDAPDEGTAMNVAVELGDLVDIDVEEL
tara:strand:+ start:2249 stop:2386 length:138 start_codon:yes stop_codon:yes gene_type:complete